MQYESNIEMGVEIRHGIEHKIEIQGFVFGNEIETRNRIVINGNRKGKWESKLGTTIDKWK